MAHTHKKFSDLQIKEMIVRYQAKEITNDVEENIIKLSKENFS